MGMRIAVGSTVRVKASVMRDMLDGTPLTGMIGQLKEDDRTHVPYAVDFPGHEGTHWFYENELELVTDSGDEGREKVREFIKENYDQDPLDSWDRGYNSALSDLAGAFSLKIIRPVGLDVVNA